MAKFAVIGLLHVPFAVSFTAHEPAGRHPAYAPAPVPMSPNEMLIEAVTTLPPLPPVPLLSEKDRLRDLTPESVLSDPLERISEEFRIPGGLAERTRFWFDVYTKYGQNHYVIHHSRYPWILFDVVDGDESVANGKGPLWLRRKRVKQQAYTRGREIRRALRSLSRRESFRGLKGLELELYRKLRALKGQRRKVLRLAAQSVRTQLGQRDFFISGLRRSSKYLPYMEQIFQHAGMPIELTRMPFVESSFNEKAYSKVGAAGIWQIMPYTGRAYFSVGEKIDERLSPLKSTMVAASLLRSYHRALKSWPLAITSYNHGIGNIQVAMRIAKSNRLDKIIDRYHGGDFKFASANFYTCFLAALYAERYGEVVFPALSRDPLLTIEQIKISKRTSLGKILSDSGLSDQTIRKYNQDLRLARVSRTMLPAGYLLHLPPGYALPLAEKLRARVTLSPLTLPRVSDNETNSGLPKGG